MTADDNRAPHPAAPTSAVPDFQKPWPRRGYWRFVPYLNQLEGLIDPAMFPQASPWDRGTTAFAVLVGGYFVTVACVLAAVSNGLLHIPGSGPLSGLWETVSHFPYVTRVQQEMFQGGASERAIRIKTDFIAQSLMAMIIGYGLALAAGIAAFVWLCFRRDRGALTGFEDPYRRYGLTCMVIFIFLPLAAAMFWVAIRGDAPWAYSVLTHHHSIIESDMWIGVALAIMTGSMSVALAIAALMIPVLAFAMGGARRASRSASV
jgi:hypothetical protein